MFRNDDAPDQDTQWLLRRVRPTFEGSFGDRVGFRIMPEFAGGTQLIDGYIDVKLGDAVTLRAGKFKAPVGLERLQSGNELRLVERSVVTDLLPNRDIGVQLSGGSRLSWQLGLFNGVNDGRSGDGDDDGSQEIAARVFAHPLNPNGKASLGIGIAATWGTREGAPGLPLLAGYRSPGQKTVFQYRGGAEGTFADGERVRISPQGYWFSGPAGFKVEWARVSQDVRRTGPGFDRSATLQQEAWQITGEWFVTGENAGFRDPGGSGALQLVARYAVLDIDEESFIGGGESFANPANAARRAQTWGVGLNWFPIAGPKGSVAWQQTSFDGGAAAGGDRPDEKVLFLRLQQRF